MATRDDNKQKKYFRHFHPIVTIYDRYMIYVYIQGDQKFMLQERKHGLRNNCLISLVIPAVLTTRISDRPVQSVQYTE